MTKTIIKDFRAVTVSISLTSKSKTPFKCYYAWNFIKIFFRVKFRNMTPMGSNDKIDSMGLSCLTYRRKVAIWSNFIKLVISRPFQIYKKYIFNYWYQISLIKKNNCVFWLKTVGFQSQPMRSVYGQKITKQHQFLAPNIYF